MGVTAATSGFVVLFLSVSVVQSSSRLTYISAHICAVRGSTVDIRCACRRPSTVRRSSVPVEKILWFTDMQDEGPVDLSTDSEYAGRVKYYCDKTTCTLRITDLRESDSAEYKFKFKDKPSRRFTRSPGVTLSVTDPDVQVQVSRSFSPWAELQCHSTCHLPDRPSYLWYKNGQNLQEETSSSYSDYVDAADSFSCAVKGHEGFPAPSVCVYGQSCHRVTYTDRSICAPSGSSVDISCTHYSVGSVTSKFWFSPERSHQWGDPNKPQDLSEDSQYTGRVQVLPAERGRSTLRISDLRATDSAQYHFRYKTRGFEWRSSLPGTTLTVTALQVQVIRVTVHQSYTHAELSCHSSCSPAGALSYVWFKNLQRNITQETPIYTDYFYPGDNISCAFKEHEDSRSLSLYGPKLPSVSVSPSAEIEEGSSVTLSCSSDANPAANYTWYKEDEDSPKESGQNFTITDFRSEHSGNYCCVAQNSRGRRDSTLQLTVGAGNSRITMTIIRSTLVVLLLIYVILLNLWTRKKKALSSTTEAHDPVEIELDSCPEYENVSDTAAQTEDTEEQEDLV
ncbi:B-cell receptor CD22-like isoform X1 [Cottoperca gobio]|uniref:B-cell receptor CD22 n=1 Tax=Cottoperca gobio TaxID=56716 RepID=A0A6J2PFW8_COTGO|nr:B-cell receptor CD22-like isoform X1 [Cottoperca gobio]